MMHAALRLSASLQILSCFVTVGSQPEEVTRTSDLSKAHYWRLRVLLLLLLPTLLLLLQLQLIR